MYRKLHHKFLQNFPVVDVSQVVMCVTSQISERVTGEGSFAKGFAMSFDSQNTIKKIKNLLDQMEAINPLNHYYNLFCLGREFGENDQLEFGHRGARRRVASFFLSDVFCVGLRPWLLL